MNYNNSWWDKWELEFEEESTHSIHLTGCKIILKGMSRYKDRISTKNEQWDLRKRMMEPVLDMIDNVLLSLQEYNCACTEKHPHSYFTLTCCNNRYHVNCFFKHLHYHESSIMWGLAHKCTFCRTQTDKRIVHNLWDNHSKLIMTDVEINIVPTEYNSTTLQRYNLSNYRLALAKK